MSSPTRSIRNRSTSSSGRQRQPALSGKCLDINSNDFTDCDNDASRIVSQITIYAVRKVPEYKDAIDSDIWLEPKEVDPLITRIKGSDIPLILGPMCNALFKKQGLVEKHDALKLDGRIAKVLKKHQRNQSSVIIQALLDENIIEAILKVVGIQEIKDELGGDRILKISKAYPKATIDKKWVQEQLRKCVRYKVIEDPEELKKASITAGKLSAQAVRKLLIKSGLLGKGDKIHLDEGALDVLEAPLCHHMEHPDWLVDHPNLVKKYRRIIRISPHSKKARYDRMIAAMESVLNETHQNSILKDGYDKTIEAGKEAKRIFFFGGASMTLLERLVCVELLGSKIEFVGQGGTLNPGLNLTGNSFNWDLNPWAAYNVLTSHAKGTHRLRSFELGTTELCNVVVYDAKEVAKLRGGTKGAKLLLNRIAAFGLMKNRINPEKTILNPEEDEKLLKSKVEEIKLPDLTAFFAAYSESFREQYCRIHHPAYMFITEKDYRRNGKVGVERVRFSDKSCEKLEAEKEKEGVTSSKQPDPEAKPKPGEQPAIFLDKSITLYLPQDDNYIDAGGKYKTQRVTWRELVKFVKECSDERKRRVADAMGSPPPPGTSGTGSATAGTRTRSPRRNPSPSRSH